ncbi:hypothetical protein [Pontixanthobacter aquaemixtae]|uniref:Uncharacterized protein n=1 Tax=Pontixanthobacter aquaemixtae TaxID=1958940 RepID=A0A844ZTG1_9SPHN|nr:hypothetical protein [Pontixanthobacter aquaemixtae]MXO90097.1 hypothetical protein [Pontixanthobacter aquaemixtae]
MSEQRIESAVNRIESALARIAEAADNVPKSASNAAPPSVSALVVKHESLRDTVANTISELDKLIGDLDQ